MKKTYKYISAKLGVVRELFCFLWNHKLWWLCPIIAILFIFIFLFILAQSTAVGPLIYSLF